MAQAPTQSSPSATPGPSKRAFGRSLSDFPNLSDAENQLVACCARGEPCVLGNRERPEAPTAANTIRAELIRFLALGGDAANPVHEEGVMLRGGWVKGELNLHQAQAAVRLDLKYCQFDAVPVFTAASLPELALSGSSVPGLNADRLTVAGGVFLRDGFAALGEVRLLGVQIGGDLECSGSSFTNADGKALNADGMKVTGSAFLSDAFAATGEVRLVGAQIDGNLSCIGGSFTNAGRPALNADRMTVAGAVFLRNGFAATGEVKLLGAQIGGNLECTGSSFSNAGGMALNADRMTVTGYVFLRNGFAATGEVKLLGAQIGGNLECSGGIFTNAEGMALNADRMTVTGHVFLRDRFEATGEVNLLGAQIGRNLECNSSSFTNDGGPALNADSMTVTGGVILRGATIKGAVKLTAAKIGTLNDDGACWQAGGHFLNGLRYDRITGPTDAKMRIKWLGQQRGDQLKADFRPQPWEQLITVLRAMGHPDEAAEVAIAKQDQLRVARATRPWTLGSGVHGALHWLYGLLAGYGHRPLRIVYWMMGVCAAFSLAFYEGRTNGYFGPTSPLIHASAAFDACGAPGETVEIWKGPKKKVIQAKPFWTAPKCPTPPEYTTFQPFFYSLDLILPLVDLHQEADWAPLVVNPDGQTLWPGRILRWMMWFEILFGWAASLTLVAVLGRLVDKD